MSDPGFPEFDPLGVELAGTHLVEANAGTGKTHSLTSLVLRLVAQARADVRALVVVTFTDAAARELRERLRQRLALLAARLEPKSEPGDDETVEALAAAAIGDAARKALHQLVFDALLRFEEASVSTIHGFCRRALDRLGLPAGVGDPEDPAPARAALVADFWRQRVIGGDAREAEWALAWCSDPDRLEDGLREAHELEPSALVPQSDAAGLQRRMRKAGPLEAEAVEQARKAQFLHDTLAFVRDGMARRQAETGVLTHDDVIAGLHRALHGDGGPANAARLARRWRFGIVDEFQDTDARQFAIFERLFGGRDGAALFLVGDPKQAIYRFRGGDIYAYGRAVQRAQQRWGLSANRRADAPLVAALNTLFGRAPVRDPFLVPFIGYAPSRAAARRDPSPWEAPAPLVIWHRPDTSPRGATKETMGAAAADATAAEIVALLEQARALGVAAPSIAVLTSTHDQGETVGAALRRARVAYSSGGRDSVLGGNTARYVLNLLRALESGDARAFRNARARALFGLPLAGLAVDSADESADWSLREQLRQTWHAAGPLALLRALLAEVAPRWLGATDGGQRFADVLQIGELLEQCRMAGQGMRAQTAWLATRRQAILAGDAPLREETPRTGADTSGVSVLTVHRAKGLQFDIVFAPFLWARRGNPPNQLKPKPMKYHDDAGELRVDLGSPDHAANKARNEAEEDAESLRQAYVALTRARHRVYTLWGRCTTASKAPLAHLIHPATSQAGKQNPAPSAKTIEDGLDALALAADGTIAIRTLGPTLPRVRLSAPPLRELVARPFERRLYVERRVLSFSALAAMGETEDPADRDAMDAVPIEDPAAAPGPIAALPRGARAGECVHAVLEKMEFAEAPGELLEQMCRRFRFGSAEREVFAEWIEQARGAQLLPGLRLRTLAQAAQARELEFHFRLDGGAAALGAALALAARYRREPEAIERLPARFAGLMHGFIDLVLRHDGRWYVVDYKTNFLGGDGSDYAPAALATAVRASDYDLQYLIYLVALHRHLRHRMRAGYVPERDLGGALYLFLRGLTDDGRAGVHLDRPPLAVIEALDRAFGGGGP